MHRRFENPCSRMLLLLASLIGALAGSIASAAPVPSLFASVVAESDPQRAARQAMREVLVRLVGSRDSGDDPALAGIVEDAGRYVQFERATTRGATQVIFDGPALRAAVAASGRSVWDPDRPLVWVLLPALGAPGTDELRRQLSAAAQTRGLPVALVSADSAGAAGVAAGPAGAASPAAVLAAARRAGATAALIGQSTAGEPESLQWTLLAAGAEGHWQGGATVAIDGATDALVRAARELEGAPSADIECRIAGVLDLGAFAAVLDAVASVPGVSELMVRAVDADQLTLRFKSRGSATALARALAAGHLHPLGTAVDGVQQYRYQGGP